MAENWPPKDVCVLIPGTHDYVLPWQMRIKIPGGIRAADQLTVWWRDDLGLPVGPSVILNVLNMEAGGR